MLVPSLVEGHDRSGWLSPNGPVYGWYMAKAKPPPPSAASTLTAEIVRFDGNDLMAARDDDGKTVWVVVKRVCEALGLDPDGQRRKLQDKAWATTEFISAVAEDGKSREMFCISLKSLPMWLATIEPSRVAEEVRPKLAVYQQKCADVLADYFLGTADAAPAATPSLTVEDVTTIAQQVMVPLFVELRGLVTDSLASTRGEMAELRGLIIHQNTVNATMGGLQQAIQTLNQKQDDLQRAVTERGVKFHSKLSRHHQKILGGLLKKYRDMWTRAESAAARLEGKPDPKAVSFQRVQARFCREFLSYKTASYYQTEDHRFEEAVAVIEKWITELDTLRTQAEAMTPPATPLYEELANQDDPSFVPPVAPSDPATRQQIRATTKSIRNQSNLDGCL